MSRAAIRYAKAILEHCNNTNTTDVVFNDMQVVQATVSNSKELRIMLKSPVVKADNKKQVLQEIFKSQSDTTKELINLLVTKQRTSILGDVAQSFIHLHNESKEMKIAEVTTAIPISKEVESQVLAKITELTKSSNITIKNIVDASIIGGFILRVGDLQYNASIANKLKNIKREFSKSV